MNNFKDDMLDKKLTKIKFPNILKISEKDGGGKKDEYEVYIKPGCYYSNSATKELKNRNLSHKVHDFFSLSELEKKNILNKTKKYNNSKEYKLYPKIFKNNTFIGGFSNLQDILNKK